MGSFVASFARGVGIVVCSLLVLRGIDMVVAKAFDVEEKK